jgi:hypothetical protein
LRLTPAAADQINKLAAVIDVASVVSTIQFRLQLEIGALGTSNFVKPS